MLLTSTRSGSDCRTARIFICALVALVLYPYHILSFMEIQAYSSSSTSGVDQSKFIRSSQAITTEARHKLVHEAFGKIAAENHSAVAVEHDGDRITYLCSRDRVVALVQRSIPMIIAIFAVLKSGCQYVPMDGGVVSDDALAHVLSETEPPFVLCQARYLQRLHQFTMLGTQILSLEDSWTTLTDSDIEAGHAVLVDPNDSAYIIYTSGQHCLESRNRSFQLRNSGGTGKPKGVDIIHQNVTNLLTVATGNLGIKPGRRVAQLLSVSSDMGRLPTQNPSICLLN